MNESTLLLRQVHPSFLLDGELSSQAFMPFPKDDGQLSTYDGDQIDAESSYRHYTVTMRLQSVGVWAVNGSESAGVGLTYRPDPVEGNPAHSVIDFHGLPEKERRKLAKRLKRFAANRGSLYQVA